MPDIVSSVISGAAGIGQLVTGIVNNAKAKKEAKELARTRPQYAISDLVGQELSDAESERASGGMSSRAERAYNNLNDKQFSSSLGAILRGGGSVNNVADVFGENEEGRQRLALLSDQMRLNQINNLTRARQSMVGEEGKAFEFNQWRPWADKSQANAAARQQAQQNIWGGIGQIAGSASSFAGQAYDEKQWDKYFKGGQGGGEVFQPNFSTPGGSFNPGQMGAGRSTDYFQPQQFQQPMNYERPYWSSQQEQEQFRDEFGLNYR